MATRMPTTATLNDVRYALWLLWERRYPAWRAFQGAFEQFTDPPLLTLANKARREKIMDRLAVLYASERNHMDYDGVRRDEEGQRPVSLAA